MIGCESIYDELNNVFINEPNKPIIFPPNVRDDSKIYNFTLVNFHLKV